MEFERNTIEFMIEKLQELYIKQIFKDKKEGKVAFVKKANVYKELEKFLKENFYE